jgi:hypothetical protein
MVQDKSKSINLITLTSSMICFISSSVFQVAIKAQTMAHILVQEISFTSILFSSKNL